MKKTQGLDGDQMTRTIGWLSTVPAHVISGFSLRVLCSRMEPSSEPAMRKDSSNGQKAMDLTAARVSTSGLYHRLVI